MSPARQKVYDQINNMLTPQTRANMENLFKKFRPMIRDAEDKEALLKEFYAMVDKSNEKMLEEMKLKASCKKGCAYCCHIRVVCSSLEADLLVDYVQQHGITIDTDRLEAVKDITDEMEYVGSKHKRCVFLGADNSCQVYEVRPFACRNYMVISEPELCNTDVYAQGETISPMNIAAMAPLITISEFYPVDSMAKLLLNTIKANENV